MNLKPSPNLRLRLVSAAILIPAVVTILYLGGVIFIAYMAVVSALALYEWFRLSRLTSRFLPFMAMGIVYVISVALAFYTLRIHEGLGAVVLLLVMVWASDVDAYITGKTLGGPKLGLAISPNKTWSGFFAAMISPAILAALYNLYFAGMSLVGVASACLMGVIIGICAQAGDLSISYLKRQAGVKDSGNLIPGHGGILDRVDSLMLCTPVFYLILSYVPHAFPH